MTNEQEFEDGTQEPNTEIIQEPNTNIIQEPNTKIVAEAEDDFQEPNTK